MILHLQFCVTYVAVICEKFNCSVVLNSDLRMPRSLNTQMKGSGKKCNFKVLPLNRDTIFITYLHWNVRLDLVEAHWSGSIFLSLLYKRYVAIGNSCFRPEENALSEIYCLILNKWQQPFVDIICNRVGSCSAIFNDEMHILEKKIWKVKV